MIESHTRGLVAGTCGRDLSLSVYIVENCGTIDMIPATSPRNQTSLIRGTSRRDQKCGPCD